MVLRILGAVPHQWYLIYCTIITKNNLLHYNAMEIAHVPYMNECKGEDHLPSKEACTA